MEDEDLMPFLSSFIALLISLVHLQRLRLAQAAILKNRQVIVKVNDFFENTAVQMTPRLFRRYFRMNRNTLHNLTNYMSQVPLVQPLRLNTRSISLAKKMAMTCCYLGSSASTIQIAHLFGVSEEAFLRVTDQMMTGLISKIHQIIRWPTAAELDSFADEFEYIGRFLPNVVGAIDDIHLEIKISDERRHADAFYCWKLYHSIHLQAVCCYDLHFMDIFVGWPGHSRDSRVFRNNPLFRTLPDRLRKVPEGRLSQSFHIVGDSAFPLSAQVLRPFKRPPHGDLNAVQKKFNKHLSS